jgi:hypothetical protein
MRNVIISFVIFIGMVIVMAFSLKYLNSVCVQMERSCDKLEELINNKDWERAYDDSNKLLEEWKKHSLIIPIFANHAELDTLNSEMLKLTQFVKCKTQDEALASLHVIKFYLDNTKKLQKVNLQNIF